MDLYPSLKSIKIVKEAKPKEIVPKGMIRASKYDRERGRIAFKKPG